MGVELLIERLEAWDKWPAAWDPEKPGEIIAGKVVEYAAGETPYGRCHCVVIEVQARQLDGRRVAHPARLAVWLSKEVLLREFKQQRPQVGELVAIKYVGAPDKESAYHQYKLIVDRPPAELELLGGEEPPVPKTSPRAANAGPRNQPGVTAGRDRLRNGRAADDGLGISRADLPAQRPLAGVSRH